VAVSATAAVATARADAQRSNRAFTASSAAVASTLQLAIRQEQDLVVSARGFFADTPHAAQPKFLRWIHAIRALKRNPELSSLGFAVIVPRQQLLHFSRRELAAPIARAPTDATYHVLPAGSRPYYCLASVGQTRSAALKFPVGLDVCAAGGNGPAALTVRDTGQGSYTPLTLGTESLLVLQVPVYRGGVTPTTVQARRLSFLGWVGVVITPKVILDRALRGHPGTGVTMRYHLGTTNVAFHSGPTPAAARTSTADLHNGWTIITAGVAVGTGMWSDGAAMRLLAGGLVVSLLLGVIIFVLATARRRALLLVERKTAEIQHMALHDVLTGLPNRALIMNRVTQAMAQARRNHSAIGLMFLDLDSFKGINDTFGHAAGDKFLCAVASRLTAVLRSSDTVGRIGGDEFVILLESASMEDGPEIVAERIRAALGKPIRLDGCSDQPVKARASIGIAVGVRATADDLLHDADLALYAAKGAGKDRYVLCAAPDETVRVDMNSAL
jgi:diguanylate cyclase (GGDEF)-like protein